MARYREPARRARETRIARILLSTAVLYATVCVVGPFLAPALGLALPWGLYPLLLFGALGGMILVQRRQRRSTGSRATRTLVRASLAFSIAVLAALLHWIAIP